MKVFERVKLMSAIIYITKNAVEMWDTTIDLKNDTD